MPIPKIIHYCWFGHNKLPDLAVKCIASWKKKCPDYQIIEWNESNFDISKCPIYVRQAYEAKKWAFVTDYVRLQVVYECGGIYLDTDVELKKNLDFLLDNQAFFGMESKNYVNTGLGFGADKGHSYLYEMMQDYQSISFVREDGTFDDKACPVRNTDVFVKHGFEKTGETQSLPEGVLVLAPIYMSPLDFYTNTRRYSLRTISIHWYSGSWLTEEQRKKNEYWVQKNKEQRRRDFVDYVVHMPNRAMIVLLGEERYENFKTKLKR